MSITPAVGPIVPFDRDATYWVEDISEILNLPDTKRAGSFYRTSWAIKDASPIPADFDDDARWPR